MEKWYGPPSIEKRRQNLGGPGLGKNRTLRTEAMQKKMFQERIKCNFRRLMKKIASFPI